MLKIKKLLGIKNEDIEDNKELSTEEIADKLNNLTTMDCIRLNDKKSTNKQKVKVKINTNASSNVNPIIKTTTANTNTNTNSNSNSNSNINLTGTYISSGCNNFSSLFSNCSTLSADGDWLNCDKAPEKVYTQGIVICEELTKREYGFTKIDNLGIYSDIEKDTNFLIMIKALKDLLIKENIITKEKFDEIYNSINEEREEIILANKTIDKLSEDEPSKKPNWFNFN